MAVIYVVPTILENEQVQELPDQVIELASEWLEELKPSSEEE